MKSDSFFALLLLVGLLGRAEAAPQVLGYTLEEGVREVLPDAQESAWLKIGWRDGLMTAVAEAEKLDRPVLLWTMNGNPCGET